MKIKLISIAVAGVFAVASGSVLAGDAAAGKVKAAVCAGCHGADGVSPAPTYPNLKGQKEAYIVKAINDFKSGARTDPTMKAMAAPLTNDEIANLAAYFSSL